MNESFMDWRFVLSLLFALAYLAWISRGRKAYGRAGTVLFLVGLAGILLHLSSAFISNLPSHAPLRTVIGLATDRSTTFFDHRHSDFTLLEDKTGRRILLATTINGPWADQPVRATYLDDGGFMPSVVRIEILSADQFPWHVEKGHAGWVGTAEGKRRAPLTIRALEFILILIGAFAPTTRNSSLGQSKKDEDFAQY